VDDFFRVAQLVALAVTFKDQIVEIAEDCAEVFAGGDGSPAADGVEADCYSAFGQERRSFAAEDCIGMVDAENEEADAVGGCFAVGACAACGGEFIRTNNVLGAEVA
jgi:hypothetical protein